jgi:hypothetical protein
MNNKTISDQAEEKQENHNPFEKGLDWLKEAAVPLMGASAFVANVALAIDGGALGFINKDWKLRDDKALIATGAFGAIAPLILAIYGNGNKDAEFDRMMEDMRQHFIAQGIDIPEDEFTKQKSTGLAAVNDFIKEHPVEVSSALAFIGTTALWAAGWKEFKEEGKITKISTATTTLIGYLMLATVPEESPLAIPKTEEELAQMNIIERLKYEVGKNPFPYFTFLNFFDMPCWISEALEDSFQGKVIPGQVDFEFPQGKKRHFEFPSGRDGKIEHFNNSIMTLNSEIEEKQTAISQLLNKYSGAELSNQQSSMTKELSSLQNRLGAAEGGIDYLSNDKKILFGMDQGQVSGVLKFATAAGFTTQILLNLVAHKNQSAEAMQADYDNIFAASAQRLLKIEPEMREVSLKQMVTFLSFNKSMDNACMDPIQIKEAIEKQIEVLEKQPQAANDIKPFAKVNQITAQGTTKELELAGGVKK